MLFLFDVDGTLIEPFLLNGKLAQPYVKVALLPGRREKLEALRAEGHDVALCTNQGSVALGLQKRQEVEQKMLTVLDQLGIGIDFGGYRDDVWNLHARTPSIYVALRHPKAFVRGMGIRPCDDWRKPGPGMLRQAILDWSYDCSTTMYVGDLPTDEQAAVAAGVQYEDAASFFGGER